MAMGIKKYFVLIIMANIKKQEDCTNIKLFY